jgi:hypothetical protein
VSTDFVKLMLLHNALYTKHTPHSGIAASEMLTGRGWFPLLGGRPSAGRSCLPGQQQTLGSKGNLVKSRAQRGSRAWLARPPFRARRTAPVTDQHAAHGCRPWATHVPPDAPGDVRHWPRPPALDAPSRPSCRRIDGTLLLLWRHQNASDAVAVLYGRVAAALGRHVT